MIFSSINSPVPNINDANDSLASQNYNTSLHNLSSPPPFIIQSSNCPTLDPLLTQTPTPQPQITHTPSQQTVFSSSNNQFSSPQVECGCDWEKLEEAAKVIANVQHAFETADIDMPEVVETTSLTGVLIDESSPTSRVLVPHSNYPSFNKVNQTLNDFNQNDLTRLTRFFNVFFFVKLGHECDRHTSGSKRCANNSIFATKAT